MTENDLVFVDQKECTEKKPSTRRKKRKRISEQDIISKQHLSQKAAAEEFGVSLSTFKRKKAQYGIKWPSKRLQRQLREQRERHQNEQNEGVIPNDANEAEVSHLQSHPAHQHPAETIPRHQQSSGSHDIISNSQYHTTKPLTSQHTANHSSTNVQSGHPPSEADFLSQQNRSMILVSRAQYNSLCRQLSTLREENRILRQHSHRRQVEQQQPALYSIQHSNSVTGHAIQQPHHHQQLHTDTTQQHSAPQLSSSATSSSSQIVSPHHRLPPPTILRNNPELSPLASGRMSGNSSQDASRHHYSQHHWASTSSEPFTSTSRQHYASVASPKVQHEGASAQEHNLSLPSFKETFS